MLSEVFVLDGEYALKSETGPDEVLGGKQTASNSLKQRTSIVPNYISEIIAGPDKVVGFEHATISEFEHHGRFHRPVKELSNTFAIFNYSPRFGRKALLYLECKRSVSQTCIHQGWGCKHTAHWDLAELEWIHILSNIW